MGVPPDSPRTTNPYTFRSSPPDLDRLRELRNYEIREVLIGYAPELLDDFDELVNSHFWLISLVDEGGRLVVEAPCEHGVFHDSCDQLVCGHDHLLTDGWHPDARFECWCPGGSRRQVWPTDKEETDDV